MKQNILAKTAVIVLVMTMILGSFGSMKVIAAGSTTSTTEETQEKDQTETSETGKEEDSEFEDPDEFIKDLAAAIEKRNEIINSAEEETSKEDAAEEVKEDVKEEEKQEEPLDEGTQLTAEEFVILKEAFEAEYGEVSKYDREGAFEDEGLNAAARLYFAGVKAVPMIGTFSEKKIFTPVMISSMSLYYSALKELQEEYGLELSEEEVDTMDSLLEIYELFGMFTDTEETAENTEKKEKRTSTVSAEGYEIDDQLELVGEYTRTDSYGWYTTHFLIVKNISDETLDISSATFAYDEDGEMLGYDDADFTALSGGCTSVIIEYFEVEGSIASFETSITAKPCKYYTGVIQDLSSEVKDVKTGVVVKVTNDGEIPAMFVEGYALFFKDDELVGYTSSYFDDDDSELKPGDTISKQLTIYQDYDRAEVYFTGRGKSN
ncbi:MAG: hypothetical protein IKF45_07015 [Lachnospiraceae bacterium]|nr:hypothetical protein [Lachnospiraceae bacterium]